MGLAIKKVKMGKLPNMRAKPNLKLTLKVENKNKPNNGTLNIEMALRLTLRPEAKPKFSFLKQR